MFKNIKELIDARLGKLIILDSFDYNDGTYLLVEKKYLVAALFFLKNDPDTRLTLLDQIYLLKGDFFPWQKEMHILYHLKSLRLPYKVILCLPIISFEESVLSINHLYLGAKWLEEDIKNKYGVTFEENL